MILRTPSVIFTRRMIRVGLAPWLLSIILLALLSTPALAQGETWQPIGPAGDQVCESTGVAVVPGADGGIYTAGPGCGVFYSEDGGETWVSRSAGLPVNQVTALAVAPSQPSRLYAGADRAIYRSDDGGRSWRQVFDFFGVTSTPDVARIIVHPTDPNTLYAITRLIVHPTASDTLYVISQEYGYWGRVGILYQSQDGGENWSQLSVDNAGDITFDPDDPGRMYVTVTGAILRSDDGWMTWEVLPVITPRYAMVEHIYMPSSSVIYVSLASGGGVYRADDAGASWTAISQGLPDTFITALGGDPANPMRLIAAGHGGDIFRYDPDAPAWSQLAGQEATPFSTVTRLLPDQADASPGMLAATPQGLFRSQDGTQWRLLSEDVRDRRMNVHDLTVTADPQGRVWVAGGLNGVLSRPAQTEEGVSPPWTVHNSGLEGQRVLSLAVDPQDPDILYAGTETNLFKSEDRGQSWRESDAGLEPPPLPTPSQAATQPTGLSVTALAVDPSDGQRVYAGTSQGLFISNDGGASWAPNTDFADVPNWPAYPTIRQIALAPSDPDTLYAVVRLGLKETYIFNSTDRGQSWDLPISGGMAIPDPQELAVDPQDAETLYSVAWDGVAWGGIWKSEDGGHTWRLIGPGVAGAAGSYITIADQDGIVIAAVGVRGEATGEPREQTVHLSWDGGDHWIPVDSGLGDAPVTGLAFDPDRPASLYAGVAEGGVIEADFARRQTFLPAVFAR